MNPTENGECQPKLAFSAYALGDDVIARIMGAVQDAILLAASDSPESADVGDVMRQIRVEPDDAAGCVRLTSAYRQQYERHRVEIASKLAAELEGIARGS